MAALHGSDDDFLFEVQCPKSWLAEQSAQPETKTPADGLLARFLRRLGMRTCFTPRPLQSQIQPAGIGKSYYPEIGRTFHPNPRHYLAAKHPPLTSGQ